jgi:hypothetical protein
MQILWANEFLDATIDYSTESPNYPVTNLQDTRLSRKFRTTDITDEYVKVSTRLTASRVAIMGHNFPAATVIKIQGNDTDVWTAPSLDETLTWSEGIIIGTFTECTYSYWRITFTVASGVTYFEIGSMFLGTFLQLPGMKPDQSIDDETTSVSVESASGQTYGDIGYDYRAPVVNFPYMTEAQRTGIRAMWADVRNVKPIIIVIWATRTDIETPIYCKINQNKITFKRTGSPTVPWSTTIAFKEVF